MGILNLVMKLNNVDIFVNIWYNFRPVDVVCSRNVLRMWLNLPLAIISNQHPMYFGFHFNITEARENRDDLQIAEFY